MSLHMTRRIRSGEIYIQWYLISMTALARRSVAFIFSNIYNHGIYRNSNSENSLKTYSIVIVPHKHILFTKDMKWVFYCIQMKMYYVMLCA